MRKERTLFIIGIWVIVLPFLGFPEAWRHILFVMTGLALAYLSYLYYKEAKMRQSKNSNTESKTFVDNIGSGE